MYTAHVKVVQVVLDTQYYPNDIASREASRVPVLRVGSTRGQSHALDFIFSHHMSV